MQLGAWITLCLLGSFVLRKRILVLVIVSLVLWAAVPGVASSLVTGVPRGNPLAFHFATWLIVTSFLVQTLHDLRAMLDELARHIFTYLFLAVFLSATLLATATSVAGGGLVLFFSQMLGPILLFFLINLSVHQDSDNLYRLRNWIIAIAATQSVIALIEWFNNGVLFYRPYYAVNYWWDEVNFPRWMGTLDHPLTLSLLVGAAVPLLAGLGSVWWQLSLLVIMGAGVLVTQSRTGLAVFALGVLYVIIASKMRALMKVLTALAMLAAGVWAASSQLGSGVAQRLADDGGSSSAREGAINFFLNNIPRFLINGGGIGSASGVSDAAGFTTSLESSFLIYAVDSGIVFAVLYFGVQVALVVRSSGYSPCRGLALAGMVVIIVPQTYNALNSQTLAGPLVWAVLAMCSSMADLRQLQKQRRYGELADVPQLLP